MTTITYLSNINLNKLTFGVPKVRSNGSKSIPVLLDGKKLLLVLPNLTTAFGVNQYKENNPYDVRLNMDDAHPEIQSKLSDMDQLIVQQASTPEFSASWLGSAKSKPFSPEVVASKYHSLLQFSKDKTTGEINTRYPPFIRIKIQNVFGQKDQFSTEFFDNKKQSLKVDASNIKNVIAPHTTLACLVGLELYSTATGFGISLSAKQIKMMPNEKQFDKCMLSDDSDENSD